MDFLNEIGARYEGVFTLLSLTIGLAGFIYGAWHRERERKTKSSLNQKQKELDVALARLKHLEKFASGLHVYEKAV